MQTTDLDFLRAAAEAHGVPLDETALERFAAYAELLVAHNRLHNLTAITEPAEIVRKHFLDSLLLLPWTQPAAGSALLDIGSGAGFPGVPAVIARPDLAVTLLESNGKKADFLLMLRRELGLPLKIVRARAEDAARDAALRESFAVVTARAVAPLCVLAELCLPFAAVNGRFAALKGSEAAAGEELKEAQNALRVLGGGAVRILAPAVPLAYGERCCVLVGKISQTPLKYPRSYGIITKKNI